MRLLRFIWCGFLLAVLAGSASAQTIYAIGAGGDRPMTVVRQDEHFWVITSQSGWYGLFQFSDRTSKDAPWIRRTSVHFGTLKFTVRLPAVAVIAIVFLVVASIVLPVATFMSRLRRVHRHADGA
jgi:hypothetical protein